MASSPANLRLTAEREDEYIIAQANTPLAADGTITAEQVIARYRAPLTSYARS